MNEGGCDDVKHGKKPTVAQIKLLKAKHLNAENWLVVKNQPDRLEIVNRWSGQQREIPRN